MKNFFSEIDFEFSTYFLHIFFDEKSDSKKIVHTRFDFSILGVIKVTLSQTYLEIIFTTESIGPLEIATTKISKKKFNNKKSKAHKSEPKVMV